SRPRVLLCTYFSFPPVVSLPCSGAHRVLHSFPTRRSSDLGHLWAATPAALPRQQEEPPPCPSATLPDSSPRSRSAMSPMDMAVADRKSTRLNSSHVSISYAVFCLKQKK